MRISRRGAPRTGVRVGGRSGPIPPSRTKRSRARGSMTRGGSAGRRCAGRGTRWTKLGSGEVRANRIQEAPEAALCVEVRRLERRTRAPRRTGCGGDPCLQPVDSRPRPLPPPVHNRGKPLTECRDVDLELDAGSRCGFPLDWHSGFALALLGARLGNFTLCCARPQIRRRAPTAAPSLERASALPSRLAGAGIGRWITARRPSFDSLQIHSPFILLPGTILIAEPY